MADLFQAVGILKIFNTVSGKIASILGGHEINLEKETANELVDVDSI